MIINSPHGSLPGTALRDSLRSQARAAEPAGGSVTGTTAMRAAADEVPFVDTVPPVWIGPYRLSVDADGRLAAVHGPTGAVRVLFDPHAELQQDENDGQAVREEGEH